MFPFSANPRQTFPPQRQHFAVTAQRSQQEHAGPFRDFAGNYGELVRWIAIQGATYRVCTQASGWLPWVSGYNTADLEWGCAGDGSPIVALEVVNTDIKYQVHVYGGEWYAEMQGQVDTGGSPDTYAGDMWNPIDAVSMRRA